MNRQTTSPGPFQQALAQHETLAARRIASDESLAKVSRALAENLDNAPFLEASPPLCVICTGSIGRADTGAQSDLDLFVISGEKKADLTRLQEMELLSRIININRDLGYPNFSNYGRYFKVYYIDEILRAVGSPRDDAENLFTARLLLLLESRCAWGDLIYQKYLNQIVDVYFRDSSGKKTFRPLFLLNDLLRFWRTLCLNYEELRNESRPWRKKNINLKFSRMLTVFGTVLPIVTEAATTKEAVQDLCAHTPIERLSIALDKLADESLLSRFSSFLDDYAAFLAWKDDKHLEKTFREEGPKKLRDAAAERFATFLYEVLTHEKLRPEYRRYLVV